MSRPIWVVLGASSSIARAFARLAGYYPGSATGPTRPADPTQPPDLKPPADPTGPKSLAGHSRSGRPDYQTLVRHLATHAADTFGLRDRGRVAPGLVADLCVIGPSGLAERATYDAPTAVASGVILVLVNGAVAWRVGAPEPGARTGRLIS